MKETYQKRAFRSLPDWTVGGHAIKTYGITIGDGPPEVELVRAAESFTERALPPAAESEGESERLGYVILHTGTLGTWLLIHWWAHGDICCQRLALAAPGTNDFESMDHRPLLACVWEQVVMQHERQAWVRHMMSAEPDPDGYREDKLPDGRY